jgi:hypothetical protein
MSDNKRVYYPVEITANIMYYKSRPLKRKIAKNIQVQFFVMQWRSCEEKVLSIW